MSDECIKSPATSDNSLTPSLNQTGFRTRIEFDGQCLKQDKVIFSHGIKFDSQCLKQGKVTFSNDTVVNIYIVYEINLWPFKQSVDLTWRNSSFGAVKLTKNADFD